MEKLVEQIVNSLGEPVEGNEYVIKPIDGVFWIEHKGVGSSEPLNQWLETEIKKFKIKRKPKILKQSRHYLK